MSTREQQELQSRQDKLAAWERLGFQLYPADFHRTHTASEVKKLGEKSVPVLEGSGVPKGKSVTVAGRLMTLRPHGSLWFATLSDFSGTVQVAAVQEGSGQRVWELLQFLDRGDIVGFSGPVVKTKRGEVSVFATQVTPLAKCLEVLPEKWHGLKDVEARLRQRYVDLLMDTEAREMFRRKSIFWQTARQELAEAGFMEVSTPALEVIAGGADASPFITHHDALDQDFYLRISLELPLKRLLVGGFEKVFEIGKVFRNEGVDTEHLQDYDMCEFYWAYADYEDMMDFTEKMYQQLVKSVTGGLKTTYDGKEVDWSGKWPRKDYFELIKEISGEDLAGVMDVEKLRKLLAKHKVRYEESMGVGRLIDLFWKKLVRPKVAGPLFVINHPVEVSPLAKRDPKNQERTQRMQIIVAGSELGNGFSELNDPADQRARFAEQAKLRTAGDSEAMMSDEDFITALSYGMPPAAGFGFSERLFAFIVDKPIRETVLFPPMRSK
ncbi:MAG: lysine--tRNA ligase [Candidatus Kerfeldbacteria bacterium]|nr:lysine--tRNA ligase [Candidatus Kerfeldbacteria bacterium]